MKIVVAPDSFKESMTAIEACRAIESGIKNVDSSIDVKCVPMADGGEGTGEVLETCFDVKPVIIKAHDAYMNDIETQYLCNDSLAIIELAQTCGLERVNLENRKILKATSYGFGEVIKHAISQGIKKMILTLGGSATNDGGLGMLYALGAKFFDEKHKLIVPSLIDVERIEQIDLSSVLSLFKNIEVEVACDVLNPYCGKDGATIVFGKQKGATKKEVDLLENKLCYLNELFKKQYGINLQKVKRTGAAGGVSGALFLLNTRLCNGIDLVIKNTKLVEILKDADYCISGEGSIDAQSVNGKTISGIANICKRNGIKLIVFGGRVDNDISDLYDLGITAAFSITNEAKPLPRALKEGKVSLEKTVENVVRLILNRNN